MSKSKVADAKVSEHLESNNVTVHEYNELGKKITEYATALQGKKVLLDEGSATYKTVNLLKSSGFEIFHKSDMVGLMKAAKNRTQMEGMRQCNIRDCAAIMKYFAFLEEELQKPDHGLDEYIGA